MSSSFASQSVSTTLTLCMLAGALYIVAQSIWRLYFSPIAKFPGPKLAALTYWYETYYDIFCGGEYLWKIKELHEQYGPILRINPHELHVSDPEFYHILYAGGINKRDRDPWHTASLALEGSMLASPKHELHRKRRGALAPFFSKESSRRLLPFLQERIDTMVRRLEEMKDTEKVVNLIQVLSAFSNDVVMEVCFGRHEHRLDDKDFDPSYHSTVLNGGKSSVLFRHFPIVLKIVFGLPQRVTLLLPDFADLIKQRQVGLLYCISSSKKKSSNQIVLTSAQEIGANIESIRKSGKLSDTDHDTIFHHLLKSDLPPSEKTTHRLTDEGITVVGAGSHTVAWTLSVACYEILASPTIFKNIKAEFSTIKTDEASLAVFLAQLEKLPYLTAVIKEALRLAYGVSLRIPRTAPDTVLNYKGWEIPPGTAVAMTTVLLHQDSNIFPQPLEFKPERWLNDKERSLDRYLTSFSAGSRVCLGMNLAWAELYLTLWGLFSAFGGEGVRGEGDKAILELYETDRSDVQIRKDFFFPTVKESSKGVRVVVKS
ncbi:hypothetical protein EG329_005828 [Mollisiaceae sp. DMI_Dod_QoI]|nr:hypothetical protein EG329_005828 [Helotiales sp. DMI_Dod_QoI]